MGKPYSEPPPEIEAVSSAARSGVVIRRALHQSSRFVVPKGTVIFPQSGGTYQDLETFWEARSGSVRGFLYAAKLPEHRIVSGAALGTGTGTQAAFLFSTAGLHRYIHHTDFGESATTLEVRVAGVLQVFGTDYTFGSNGTDPTVTFLAGKEPAAAAAVTASYEYYCPVFFEQPLLDMELVVPGPSLSAPGTKRVTVQLAEVRPGWRYA